MAFTPRPLRFWIIAHLFCSQAGLKNKLNPHSHCPSFLHMFYLIKPFMLRCLLTDLFLVLSLIVPFKLHPLRVCGDTFNNAIPFITSALHQLRHAFNVQVVVPIFSRSFRHILKPKFVKSKQDVD